MLAFYTLFQSVVCPWLEWDFRECSAARLVLVQTWLLVVEKEKNKNDTIMSVFEYCNAITKKTSGPPMRFIQKLKGVKRKKKRGTILDLRNR